MIKRFFHRRIAALEKAFGYDASYLHEIADISPAAIFKFGLFQVMSAHRDGVPKDAWYAARLAAALDEDCGPCTQIVVDMALKDRVPPAQIASLLNGDFAAAGEDAVLGFRFGHAVAARTDAIMTLSAEAERRFGKRGLVSLAYAVACSRVYPALKRALGHGQACIRVRVGDEPVTIHRAA